jgi:hypothetical protein
VISWALGPGEAAGVSLKELAAFGFVERGWASLRWLSIIACGETGTF